MTLRSALSAAALAGACLSAHAAVFDLTVTPLGTNAGAALAITTAGDALSFEAVITVSGTVGSETITSLVAPGGFGGNDNLFRATPAFFTGGGLTFASSTDLWNLYFDGSGYALSARSQSDSEVFNAVTIDLKGGTPIVTPIPEPETWALMGLGLAAVAGWTRRQRVKATG